MMMAILFKVLTLPGFGNGIDAIVFADKIEGEGNLIVEFNLPEPEISSVLENNRLGLLAPPDSYKILYPERINGYEMITVFDAVDSLGNEIYPNLTYANNILSRN